MNYQQQVCTRCGKPLMSGSQFCTNCGSPVQPAVNPVSPPVNNYQPANGGYQPVNNGFPPINAQQTIKAPPGLTKKQFMKDYSPEFNKNIRTSAIIGYVCTGISTILFILGIVSSLAFLELLTAFDIIFSLLEILLILGFSLGIHLGKSKGCAIAFLVTNIVFSVVGLILYGVTSGWLVFAASITAIVAFSKLDKQYKQYLFETANSQPVNSNQQFNNNIYN